jgi:hypothetical protein
VWFRVKSYLAALGLFLAGITLVYSKGKSDARDAASRKRLQDEVDAHDRITDADTGGGATDAERIKRLQHLGQQWDRDR